MKKILSIVLLTALILTMLVSCGGSSSLKGTWVNSLAGMELFRFEFTDKQVSYYTYGIKTITADYTVKDGEIIGTVDGVEVLRWTYSLDGKQLTINLTGVGTPIVCEKK